MAAPREGNLEAPTRHPIDWKNPEFYDEEAAFNGAGAHLRHLPRLPPLRQPVRLLPDAVRPDRRRQDGRGRRRRQEGLLEGRRPVLPVRPVLHDQVPLRAAARVERGLSRTPCCAPRPSSSRRAASTFGEKFLSSTDVHGQFAGIPIVVQVANAVNQTKPARAAMESVLDVDRNAWLPALATRKFRSAAPKSKDFAVKDGVQDAGQGGDLRHLLRQLQRARHRHGPAQGAGAQRSAVRAGEQGKVLRHAQAGAGRPGLGGREQGGQHPGAGEVREEGYAILSRRAQLHADVQAGTAADVPG